MTMTQSKIIHISYASGFRFKGVTFQWHDHLGPTIINRHTENERPCKNISLRVWGLITQFSRLTKEQREDYAIY